MTLPTDTYSEYRLCGKSVKRGSWWGPWFRDEPSKDAIWEAQQTAKRNDETWWEFRTVTISNERREEVED